MEIKNQTQSGLLQVIAFKVVGHISKTPARQLGWEAIELCLGLFFGALAVSPTQTLDLITNALKTQDFAPIKFIAGVILFLGRKKIFKLFKKCAKLVQRKNIEPGEKLLDAIPVPELVDYLMRNQKFKREGVNGVRATFGLNMERFNKLASKLEENQVLVRGENNGRVLASNWSRQSLIDYLSGKNKSEDLMPRFKITRIGVGQKVRLDRSEIATC